jgi:hypothetical protein
VTTRRQVIPATRTLTARPAINRGQFASIDWRLVSNGTPVRAS